MSVIEQSFTAPDDRISAVVWHKSSPSVLRQLRRTDRESAAWDAWKQLLRKRKKRIDASLPWGNAEILDMLSTAEGVETWLDEVLDRGVDIRYAVAALTWCRRLPELCHALPPDLWWKLWDHLVRAAVEADIAPEENDCTREDAIVRQLLAGELALTLACLFPEIKICRRLRSSARRVLSEGLADLLDGKGLSHAKHFERFQTLFACWTRCRTLGKHFKGGCWNAQAENQFRRLMRNALRLMRRDGTLAFSEPSSRADMASLLSTAVALSGKKPERAMADAVLGGGQNKRRKACSDVPPAKVHSEWAATAVLRPDWRRSGPRLTVFYPDKTCRVELAVGRDVLFSGQWGLDVEVDGQKTAATSEWSEMCWVSDEDVDYLELEIELGKGLRVQRHFLLARRDGFLFLADSVLGSRCAKLAYRGTLPLRSDVAFRENCETRQGVLAGDKPRAAVFPLALPQELSKSFEGGLTTTCDGLQLYQAADARSLMAPLFLDLDAGRFQKPVLWRRLTVAESWKIQPDDVAVGYRVAIGRRQWLIYRSLARPGNRSVLGHNISNEMLVARFGRDGEVTPLIEIEQN